MDARMGDMIRERYDTATDNLVEAVREAVGALPPRQAQKLRKALATYDKAFAALMKAP